MKESHMQKKKKKKAEYIGGDLKALLRILSILIKNVKLPKNFKQGRDKVRFSFVKEKKSQSLKNGLGEGTNEEATATLYSRGE